MVLDHLDHKGLLESSQQQKRKKVEAMSDATPVEVRGLTITFYYE